MKKLIIIAALIVFALSASTDANANYSKRVGGYFYTSLSPYGTWIEIGFGTPVWRPTILKRGWNPYTLGRWIYTDYGWYWDSYEDFGYIVYHYGRWYYDDYYGWIWIPDYEWAPAWVDWRYDDDYIGWAPLPPYALFSINIGIHYTYDYYVPYYHWNYVKYNHFCSHNVYNYYVAPKYKYRVHNRTKTRTNYSYYDGRVRNDGVDFNRVRERSGRDIEKRNLRTVSDPNEIIRNTERDNNREIRTYIANRDDLSRDGLRDVKIERNDRKSSLELSKIELGRDRNLDRSDDNRKNDTREVIRNDRTKNDDVRNEKDFEIIRKKDEDRKLQEKREIEKRNSESERINNEQIRRNEENRRNEELRKNEETKRREEQQRIEQIKRNEQVEIQRRANEEMQKRNESIRQQREESNRNTEVYKRNNERKVEQRQEVQKNEQRNQNNNSNRNTEVNRNDSGSRNNNRSTDQDNRTRNR